MKYMYYAVFTQENDYIDITFPDLKGCITFGDNLEEALYMSKDALEGYLLVLEDEKKNIPKSSTYQELQSNLNENQQLQLINVDTEFVRRKEENKSVNKMVTLPKWLVDLGKERKVNFSQVLQQALKNELGV
ncbi:type II toxin-antitoxin system HicB family antitoxin [Gemella cuniculi]|uniref:type II toxin-antitoxin system HicB family antitoxin n=1 Tax=Gemella cuniculi TaxID=150240 RepID=UPI0004122C82|nr:type II toxin-antitoxin system HicB family antitoxin [Gemella cuniculi]